MVYKNGIPYDISYQVTDKDCPEIPNTIERLSDNSGKFLVLDNSWLPYLRIRAGEYLFDSNNRLNSFDTIKLIPEDVPAGCQLDLNGAAFEQNTKSSQILIDNRNARWGAAHLTGADTNLLNLAVIDEKFTGYTQWAHSGDIKTRLLWVPNGTIQNVCHWTPENNTGIAIINALNMIGLGDNASNIYETIYLNEELHQKMLDEGSPVWIDNFEPHTVEYAADETEWLENYFNITQDGQTLEWYEDTIINNYGKYVRLKKNNVNVGELMYWKDGEIEEEIGANLTDNTVTKTGFITLGELTKTYSVTQKPIERTIKVRMYFNPVEQDGKMFNNFCMWPFDWTFGVAEGSVTSTLNCIKRIRYRAVGDTTWTNMSLPTAAELKNKSTDIAGHDNENILNVYTTEINTPGYYDVEWTYYPEKLWNIGKQWTNECARIVINNRKLYYDTVNHYYEQKVNEDMDLENTPFVTSLDLGQQWCTYSAGVVGEGSNIYIRDWDGNPRMETLSIGPSPRSATSTHIVGATITRGLKYIVYNNLYRGNKHYDWVACENWDSKFTNEGILFYVTPERQRFDNWFLGCSAAPHIIYLHPDIYAMDNHGFDDTLQGWEQWRYSDAGSPEIRELPNNWRELVPNYIGE